MRGLVHRVDRTVHQHRFHNMFAGTKPEDTCRLAQINDDPKRLVCVCDEGGCSDIKFQWPEQIGKAIVISSTMSGRRFEVRDLDEIRLVGVEPTSVMEVNLTAEMQSVLGWGGAITDSAAINYNNLPEPLRAKLLESYYGANGLQYNIGRIPIGGSDFSSRAYTYDDSQEVDLELKHWSLAPEDLDTKIPMAKAAREMAKEAGGELKLVASPWSPPKWMKDNNKLVRGHLIDSDEIHKTYTEYLMKFYDAYEKEGIKFWGATVQNEPVAANLPFYFFNSLQMSAEQTIKFITKYLGPALESRGYTKENFKLMIGDDSLGFINYLVPKVMANPDITKYVSGLAFHWYTSGLVLPYNALNRVWQPLKGKLEFLMMSEACAGSNPGDKKVDLGSWHRGELYASDIIEDFRRGASSWVDWNLALDLQGGPNWASNFVDSPIIVDAEKKEFYKQPMYYALGHFSRVFRPGTTVVESSVRNNGFSLRQGVTAIAGKIKESGHVVMTILNRSNISRKLKINLKGLPHGNEEFTLELERNSFTSIVMKA